MTESLVMDNSSAKREASVMHNLRSLRMGGAGMYGGGNQQAGGQDGLNSNTTEGRMNEARQSARVDSSLNMRMAGAKAYKAGAKSKAEGKNIRGGALKQGGRLLNRAGLLRKAKSGEERNLATAGMQEATSGVLKSAWLSIIPSYGLSLLWINIHAFMRWIFPQFFCKLGSEWFPKPVKQMTGGKTGAVSFFAYILESMLLAILDILIFVLVAALITLVAVVASGTWSKIKMLWYAVFG